MVSLLKTRVMKRTLNNGVVALRIPASELSKSCSAKANIKPGNAFKTKPSTSIFSQIAFSRTNFCLVTSDQMMSARAPNRLRNTATPTAEKDSRLTAMKRKESPQVVASTAKVANQGCCLLCTGTVCHCLDSKA